MSVNWRALNELPDSGKFVVCFLVVAPFYFAVKYWYVVAMLVLLGLFIWAVVWIVRIAEASNDWMLPIIKRCEEQHAALMRGDERLGIYGKWPPANLGAGGLELEDLPCNLDRSDRGRIFRLADGRQRVWTGTRYAEFKIPHKP